MEMLLFVQSAIALALAVLFAFAATHKLTDRLRFEAQLAEYDLLPARLVPAAVFALIGAEVATAAMLLWRGSWALAGLLAGALLLVYAAAIAINLLRGRSHIDCGCGSTPVLLSPWLVLRNLLLAGGALTLLYPVAVTPPLLWWLMVLPSAALLVLSYAALAQLLDNASVLREWSSQS